MSKKLILLSALTLLASFSVRAEEQNNNALVAELLFAQGKYDISGPGINYKFDSDYAPRFKFSYLRRLNDKFLLFGSFSTYEITVLNTTDNSNRKSKMGGYELGTRYYINPRWSATLTIESKKEIFFEDSGELINGVVAWTQRVNAGVYLKAFESGDFTIVPSLKTAFIFGSGDKKSGTNFLAANNFNYFLPKFRTSLGLGFESRSQQYKTVKLTESGLQFSLGLGYSF